MMGDELNGLDNNQRESFDIELYDGIAELPKADTTNQS
jgi:hypothetical protein